MGQELSAMSVIGPLIGAAVFVALMSLVHEPARRTLNAVLVAGAAGVYLSGGGFGAWELLLPMVMTPIAYHGLVSYKSIGVAWFIHSAADAVHHLWGNPIWPFAPMSSLGCLIFDAAIGVWFIMGAPAVWRSRAAAPSLDTGPSAPLGTGS
jgi:hypothetical protein